MNVVLFAFCPSSAVYVDALAAALAAPKLVVTGQAPLRGRERAPLAEACERVGSELLMCADVNSEAFVDRARGLPTDLLLVAGCPQILRAELLSVPRLGALNFHPSRLPAYRGKQPLFWALLRGEKTVAVTVHHLTSEVDAGPIVFQREVEVPARATSASLATLVDRAGASLVQRIVALAGAGALPPGVLATTPGSHFPALRAEHGLVDFARSAVEVDRLVRAAEGEIHAYCFHQGMKLIVLDGEPIVRSLPVATGRVIAIREDSVEVGTAEGAYAIRRFLFMGRVYAAPALAAELGLCPGSALDANPAF